MPKQNQEQESVCAFSGRLSAFFDGELSADESRALASHIERCNACAAELEAISTLSHMLKAARSPDASDDFRNRLAAAFARRPADTLVHMAEGLTAAAAAVLAASLIYIFATSPASAAPLLDNQPLAVISLEIQEPAFAESPAQEELARYILADLSTEKPR